MSVVDEKVFAWPEETSCKTERDTRCNTDARRESGDIGNQQKRIGGTNGTGQDFVGNGSPITGGILRQLIDEYKNQLAHENEQKKQIEAKIGRIDSRIKEFSSLLEELENNSKS